MLPSGLTTITTLFLGIALHSAVLITIPLSTALTDRPIAIGKRFPHISFLTTLVALSLFLFLIVTTFLVPNDPCHPVVRTVSVFEQLAHTLIFTLAICDVSDKRLLQYPFIGSRVALGGLVVGFASAGWMGLCPPVVMWEASPWMVFRPVQIAGDILMMGVWVAVEVMNREGFMSKTKKKWRFAIGGLVLAWLLACLPVVFLLGPEEARLLPGMVVLTVLLWVLRIALEREKELFWGARRRIRSPVLDEQSLKSMEAMGLKSREDVEIGRCPEKYTEGPASPKSAMFPGTAAIQE